MKKASWDKEYTSCNRWAEHAQKEHHLLETFARHATQVDTPPVKKRRTQPCPTPSLGSAASTTMAVLRPQLTAALNGLIRKSFLT